MAASRFLSKRWLLLTLCLTLLFGLSACQTPLDETGMRNQSVANQIADIAKASGFADGSVNRQCEIELDCSYNGVFVFSSEGEIEKKSVPALCNKMLDFVAAAKFTSWNPKTDLARRDREITTCIHDMSVESSENFRETGALQSEGHKVDIVFLSGVGPVTGSSKKLSYFINVIVG